MTTVIMTPESAVAAFFDVRGDEMVDEVEREEAVSEIGNPSANLPVTKTAETVEDYRGNGWEVIGESEVITELRKTIGQHRTARGMAPLRAYVYIADCGDYRLVYTDRG